jgi:PAS domain S-box-containing protein
LTAIFVHKWNKNVEAVTGYSEEEVRAKHVFDLFNGEDLRNVQKGIEKSFKTGRRAWKRS